MGLSEKEIYAIEVTERLGSVLSLIGTAFIIGTFLYDNAFHKPINRLVFYASWGNIMANVGTLISRSGIDLGVNQPLCQFQAFLIQMFMPADALWTLAMACNVYLTFFRKYNAQQLRALEWKYMIFCYGLPFLPAFAYFFVQSPAPSKVYGSATLWCWVTREWNFLRVATFYGPVWVVIAITFTIYLWAGKEIFAKRRQLRNFANAASDVAFPVIQNPFISPFVSVKTTEIRITSELADLPGKNGGTHCFALNERGRIISTQSFNPYSVSVGAAPGTDITSPQSAPFPRSSNPMGLGADKNASQIKAAMEANKAAFSYCKCALLFFASLLITWVPSSINRVHSLVHPDVFCFPLLFISALVLPLQGFWNAVIYIATSLPACRALFSQILDYWAPSRKTKSSSPYSHSISPKRSIRSSADSTKSFPYTGI
ncbi:hypothetical protein GJ744_006045 [Endocarpon pusillum]|uniref:G-protein coupled receptors family 2 profile 2 domain-containing protein n=1 Tax=Endocarpon pusillum TaxID=364733 RepID=A0A8H7ANK5_9EURO|nr:hypothetical protein GJ744_006045 [Endocarpon pusillum]